jgi:hypothetical protein
MLYTMGELSQTLLVSRAQLINLTIGLVGFVGSLRREYLKQQFGLFCWVHMTLLIVVVSRLVFTSENKLCV